MALFGFGKGGSSGRGGELDDPARVEAILKKAVQKNWMLLTGPADALSPQRSRLVAAEAGRRGFIEIRFYAPLKMSKGQTLEALFEGDDGRYSFTAEILSVDRPDRFTCSFPEALNDAERRRSLRVRMRRNENIEVAAISHLFEGIAAVGSLEQVAAISHLFEGIAAVGSLVEISNVGLCVKVTKIVDVASKERKPISAFSFPVGKEFAVIRVKLPGSSRESELSAKVTRTWGSAQALTVALDFEKVPASDKAAIERLVDSRASRFPASGPLFPDEEFRRETPAEEVEKEAPAPPVQKEAAPAVVPEAVPPKERPSQIEAAIAAIEATPASIAPGVESVTGRSAGAPVASPPPVLTGGVLVVGDNTFTRLKWVAALREIGEIAIRHAEGGHAALKALTEFQCRVLVVSTEIADMQVMQFIWLLRMLPGFEHTPIVVVARSLTPEQIQELRVAEVSEILLKPVEAATLVERVRRSMNLPAGGTASAD